VNLNSEPYNEDAPMSLKPYRLVALICEPHLYTTRRRDEAHARVSDGVVHHQLEAGAVVRGIVAYTVVGRRRNTDEARR